MDSFSVLCRLVAFEIVFSTCLSPVDIQLACLDARVHLTLPVSFSYNPSFSIAVFVASHYRTHHQERLNSGGRSGGGFDTQLLWNSVGERVPGIWFVEVGTGHRRACHVWTEDRRSRSSYIRLATFDISPMSGNYVTSKQRKYERLQCRGATENALAFSTPAFSTPAFSAPPVETATVR